MNASLKSVFICFSVTVLLCLFNECTSTETNSQCENVRRFVECLNRTKSDIHNETANLEFDLSSMQHAANMNTADFVRECKRNNVCIVKTHLCYLGEQLRDEWRHCFSEEEIRVLQIAYSHMNNLRNTPNQFNLENFVSLA
uniref:DUF19 domain-containing protein n=1 Tax=Trichobilharzia regenti TaxID=157069 RepID=A0AA85JXS9_TRIRE|nr:unnamed protein product [Trichobilharzia regenti]CAH8833730.1 unnamed protein product [Trichobilharzia regenti]CAH8833733.1 unnamed protein product [Trichobilharzia regenti]